MRQGEYSSPEVIVSEGLKMIQAKEDYLRRLAQLRSEIDIGLEQANRGELVDGVGVFERLMEKIGSVFVINEPCPIRAASGPGFGGN